MSRFSMPNFLVGLTERLNFFGPRPTVTLPPTPELPIADITTETELSDLEEEIAELSQPAKFFPDKPSAHDYLDFKSYAETLAALIAPKETQTPLTVGVFGAWGSGKTTLMGMIERSLRKIQRESDSQQFVFVRFDAWKYYKEDALWRAMLLRVLDVLRPKVPEKTSDKSKAELTVTIERLEQSLYRDVHWEEKGGLTIDWPKLVKAGAGGALKLSFSFVPGLSVLVKAVEAAQQTIGQGKVADDVSAVAEAFQRHIITHHQSQLQHIEQFQTQFLQLIKKHFADKRLVIFVDDLDRCLPEKAIEVLEAIKLFLDVEGCVFILGIDQEVITRGLEAKYKEVAFLSNDQSPAFSTHYIEKLIQLPFHLPPIEAPEMRSYINALNVAWPHPNCAEIFSEGLSPNPRQIKRTINVFMLLWQLAEKRRSSLGEAVTALRLAKVVILQTAYPKIFDRLKSEAVLLKQLELFCCDGALIAEQQNIDPFLTAALKEPNLKKLFQLLKEEESANFAKLEPEELTVFFSLARRAPLVSDNLTKEVVTTDATISQESRPAVLQERPSQLRSPVHDFVGRAQQLNQMITALRSDASVGVVIGMAGTGKTEFALLLAEHLRADYPDGQLLVDMHGSGKPTDTAEALSTCIQSFASHERDLPSEVQVLESIYQSHLNGKRVLVMLDDVADKKQIVPLIPPKGSALIVTSRNALVLPKMISITLDQLAPDEAMMLFSSISPTVSKDIATEICTLCGYLPLAVRAAASTLAATADLDPAAYANQLRDEQKRIELLGTEGVNVTLEASFSLSYSRLSKETSGVFRKLSVFPETFEAQAEEAICQDPNHSHLSNLVKLNLVSYEPQISRYRMHPLMRLFAQRQLKHKEGEAISKSHATHYLEVIKNADALYNEGGDSSIQALSLFDRERENINVAFKWSADRASTNREAAVLCSDYAKFASQFLEFRKSPRARVEWYTPALAAARETGDDKAKLPPLLGLGAAYGTLGETQRAIEFYTEARKIAKQFDMLQMQALIESNLGLKYRDMGQIDVAIQCFEEQRRISRELKNLRGESVALVNLATASFVLGDIDTAIKYYEEAISISRQTADLQTEGMVLGNLGRAYNKKGDPDRAIELCRQHLEISRKFGDRRGEAVAHFNIAVAFKQKGELEEARAEAEMALEIYERMESPNAKVVQEWLARLETNKGTAERDEKT